MENVFSLLRRDHARLRAFAGLGEPSRGDDTRRLARQWAIHFVSEENFLFPRLAGDAEARPLLRRLSETHASVREDFRELLAPGREPDNAGSDEARAAGLCETLRHAVELEDRALFGMAEKLISPAEAEAMARDVEEFREELFQTLKT